MTVRFAPCLVALLFAACSAPPPAALGDAPGSDEEADARDDADRDEDGAGKGGAADGPATDPTDDLEVRDFLMPDLIHTGVTGGSEVFKVPLYTDFTGQLSWEVLDPSLADVTPVDPPTDYVEAKKEEPDMPELTFAMLTAKKAGSTTVVVRSGGKTAEAELTITSYTSAAYAVGEARYRTAGTGARQPCAGCHEKPEGADHSPSWLAFFADDDVLSAIQTGVYAEDKYEVNGGDHKWNLTEEEKGGIMAYLRGLPPRGF